MPSPAPTAPPSTVREDLQARIRQMQRTTLDERALPTLSALDTLLPGGLRQGTAYSVAGSTTLAMALLAGPSAQGAWCGVLGMPDFGIEAASWLGIDLGRLVLVPDPGTRWMSVAAAMTDVLGVVIARSPARIAAADVSHLSARLRQRGATLIVMGGWPGAEAILTVVGSSWNGLGTGHGYLSSRQLIVEVSGRNGLDRPRQARLSFPQTGLSFPQTGLAFPQTGLAASVEGLTPNDQYSADQIRSGIAG